MKITLCDICREECEPHGLVLFCDDTHEAISKSNRVEFVDGVPIVKKAELCKTCYEKFYKM